MGIPTEWGQKKHFKDRMNTLPNNPGKPALAQEQSGVVQLAESKGREQLLKTWH